MKELVEHVARGLVEEPDKVTVTEIDQGNLIIYELEVAPDDMGKIIGRSGRVAKALREGPENAGRPVVVRSKEYPKPLELWNLVKVLSQTLIQHSCRELGFATFARGEMLNEPRPTVGAEGREMPV